jgi:prepilin-type processing-associated H-X9-DG protein
MYANDFDDWLIACEINSSGQIVDAKYATLAGMLMNLGYTNNVSTQYNMWSGYYCVPSTNVFTCPSLKPPKEYRAGGMTYPAFGVDGCSALSYGLRGLYNGSYFAGEVTFNTRMPKLPTLKMDFPFLVDSMQYFKDAAGNFSGPGQWNNWYQWGTAGWAYMSYTGMQLRHNRKGNVWFPDGHVGGLTAQDVRSIKAPGAGVVSGNPLEFIY